MVRLLFFLFLLALSASSCQRKEQDTKPTMTPPVDSPKAFLPYSVTYPGRLVYRKVEEVQLFVGVLDTMYNTQLSVRYPDPLHLNFHLAYWDANFDHGYDSLYYFERDYSYVRNELNTYLDSSAQKTIRFTIRGDSLIVSKSEITGGCLGWLHVFFAGRR